MRKPRDFDAELKVLGDKARQLKDRKVHQLGELVIATGADALPVELLAGLLLSGVEGKDANTREGWSKRGVAFFQRTTGNTANGDRGNANSATPGDNGTTPARSQPRPD